MIQFVMFFLLLAAPPQEGRLLFAVPADVQIVASIPSVEDLERAVAESAFGKFFADPDTKRFFESVLEALTSEVDEEMKELSPMKLFESISGGMVVFLRFRGSDNMGAAAIMEPGEKRDTFDGYMDLWKNKLYKSKEYTDFTDAYGDAEILILEPVEEDSKEATLFLADDGDVVVFAADHERVKGLEMTQAIYDAFKSDGDKDSILDSPRFQDARERLGGPGDLEIYIDLEGLLSHFSRKETSPLIKVPPSIGLDNLSYVYQVVKIGEGEQMDLSTFVSIEGEGLIRDLVDTFMVGSCDSLLKAFPKEAVAVYSVFMDVNGFYKRCLAEFEALAGEEYNQFRGGYDEMVKNRLKIDPEKEILERLDGRIGVFSVEVPEEELAFMDTLGLAFDASGQGRNGFIYLFGIKEASAFQADYEKMLRAFGWYVTLKKEEFQGQMIYSVQLRYPGLRLYWAFSEDLFGISPFPTAVRAFLRLQAHGDQPTIHEQEDFGFLLEKFRGVSGISAARTAESVQALFKSLHIVLFLGVVRTRVMNEEGNFEFIRPPEIEPIGRELIEKYFKGVTGWIFDVDEQGVYFRLVAY